MEAAIPPAAPKSTCSVATTLSFAINPLMSAVHMRQSPRPSGANIGVISSASLASRLSDESVTICMDGLKLCRNQITMVAMNIMVKALCRKSLAFSHMSLHVFFSVGMR